MRRVFTLTILVAMFPVAFTQEISYDEARKIAVEFFTNSENAKGIIRLASEIKVDTLKAYYTDVSDFSKLGSSSRLPAFYIFNRMDSPGFVIVTADKRVRIIIASSMSQNIKDINPGLQILLKQYVKEIEHLKTTKVEETKSDYGILQYIPGENWLLGNLAWGQGCQFNNFCPVDTRGPCGHAKTGCVATAMAQILSYWNYPPMNNPIPGYEDKMNWEGLVPIEGSNYTIPSVQSTSYSWARMPDKLDYFSSPEGVTEAAQLIYHCGVAVEMNYGPYESTASSSKVPAALVDYFGYSTNCDLKNKASYSWESWYNLIREELDNERPVYYRATDPDHWFEDDPDGGHAFVIDGYKDDNTFHINWGWEGSENDFYPLTLLNPKYDDSSNFNFFLFHQMITGIEPSNEENIPPQLIQTGYTQIVDTDITLTFNEPMAVTTLNASNLIVNGSHSGTHSFSIDYDPVLSICTIIPDNDFNYNETVQVTLTTGVTDLASNSLDGDRNGTPGPGFTFAFTTETNPDLLSDGLVIPLTGTTYDPVRLSVVYTDISDQTPSYVRATVGTATYTMAYESGQVASGATYSVSKLFTEGSYDFYFEALSGSGVSDRWPETGTGSFTVYPYAAGHDIELQEPMLPQAILPGRTFEIQVTVYNRGSYPETNIPVEFFLYRPDGTQCDYKLLNVPSVDPGTGLTITASLRATSTTGFYSINVIANNSLDSDRSNNSLNPKIYVGSNVDSDEYETQWFQLPDGDTGTFYGQTLHVSGYTDTRAYFTINGGEWESYEKGRLTGVINDNYALEFHGVNNDIVFFYFGKASISNIINVSPHPIVGFQGEEKDITVTSSIPVLKTSVESTFGEGGHYDGKLIESWMDHKDYVSDYQRIFSLNLPTDTSGDFHGWIKFRVDRGDYDLYINKVINVSILDDAKDLVVNITAPTAGTDFFEGTDINATATVANNSAATEPVNYLWKMLNPQGTIIQQSSGTGTIPANGIINSAVVFTTNGLSEGTYTVSLELLNHADDNPANDISQVSVDILQSMIIIADFVASVTRGNLPLSIDFSNLSTAKNTTITNWAWDFDGDGITDNTEKNTSFTFNSPGTFTVSLEAGDGTLSDVETKTDYIVVVQIAADFEADVTEGIAPLTVTFTDISSSDVPLSSWQWDFGDGESSTEQNPVHTYDQGGLFSVTLIAGNDFGDNLVFKGNYIELTNLEVVPVVVFTGISGISQTSASGGGIVVSEGEAPVTERGVCWSTTLGPTADLPTRTTDGTGTGSFMSSITGLTPGTTYFLRAYATNSIGTAYSDEITFKTYNPDAIQDSEGNYYNIITIGTQVWMAENLRYLPQVNHPAEDSFSDPLYYVYGYYGTNTGDAKFTEGFYSYGVLYNYPAAISSCPIGWHLPDADEWSLLAEFLNGDNIAGGPLKESGTEHWLAPNTGATNGTGFTGLPASVRLIDGTFGESRGYDSYFWSSSESYFNTHSGRKLMYDNARFEFHDFNDNHGLSVRCIKNRVPEVATSDYLTVGQVSANCGGTVIDDFGYSVVVRGVCWSMEPNPTVDLETKTNNAPGTGEFYSEITGLTPGTTYYLRAFATSSVGTGYGNEVAFTTYSADAVQDIDGNYYNTIIIGNQTWLTENLKTTLYNDGTPITNVMDNTEWAILTTPAYCWYDNDSLNKMTYGALYNYYAVSTSNLCPSDWHVASNYEWTVLTDYLGGEAVAGGKMKEAGTSHWTDPNIGATNESGFTALPGGTRYVNGGGDFAFINSNAVFWTSTFNYTRSLFNDGEIVIQGNFGYPVYGFSVRCVNNSIPVVITGKMSRISRVTALSEGDVLSDGGSSVTARGLCWSTSPEPTVDLETKTINLYGLGVFGSEITGLNPGTTYYLRAYATNAAGTAYGEEISFTTYHANAIQDIDGNYYNQVTIGSQTWLEENLRTTRYNDGSAISNITDHTEWFNLTDPAYCWYDNDPNFKDTYGALYNWYAATEQNLCPQGWHVPSYEEWWELVGLYGGESSAGTYLKEAGTDHWSCPNTGTNESGFSALPGGSRQSWAPGFTGLTTEGAWWGSTGNFYAPTIYWYMGNSSNYAAWEGNSAGTGYSIRCLKDVKAQQIELTEGWNLVSFAVAPFEMSVSSILASLTESDLSVKVQDEEGRAYERLADPFGWINDIGQINTAEGYKIRVSGNTTLNLSGTSVDLPFTIPLEKGWNFVGYPFSRTQSSSMIYSQLRSSGTLIKVQNEQGASIEMIDDQWNIGFSNLYSGEGYKVKTNAATELVFQITSKGSLLDEEMTSLKPVHFKPAYRGNGLDHMNIYLSGYSDEGWNLQRGDEIGVFDKGVCVGAAVVDHPENKYVSVIASSDDPVTGESDGFTEGDDIEIRIWDKDADVVRQTSRLEAVPGYSKVFEKLGTTILKVEMEETGETSLGNAYPNPAGEKTTFTFVLAEESNARFEIFDVKGQKVKILLNKKMPAGAYTLEWDNRTKAGNKAKSGYYLYQLQCGDIIQTKQLVIH